MAGVVQFLREVADMLLNEYDRWLTGTILLALAVGIADAGRTGSRTAWRGWRFVPASALAVHAGIRSHHRLARAPQAGDAAEATAVEDVSMPQLAFEAPRLELHDPAKPKQSNGVVLCAAITNSQVRDGAGGKARSAEPRITWATPVGADVHGPIDGRWQASPSSAALDLLPNGQPYLLELALKLPGEEQFRLVGRERSYWVSDGRANVTVEVHGANFAPISATYTVWSEGADESALRFSEAP